MIIKYPYLSIYSEYRFLVFFGFFGAFKLKMPSIINIMYVNNYLFFNSFLWILNSSCLGRCFLYIRNIISSYILRLFFMLRRVYKVSGIGFRFFSVENFYTLKLGYSHPIFDFLDLCSFLLRKKNRFSIRDGLYTCVFDNYRISHSRSINPYSGKGILPSNYIFIKKHFKK